MMGGGFISGMEEWGGGDWKLGTLVGVGIEIEIELVGVERGFDGGFEEEVGGFGGELVGGWD